MHVQLASAVLLTAMLVTPLASDAKKGDQLWTERRNSAPKYTQIPDFAALAEAVMPGVVSISVEQKARVSSSRGRGMSGPEEFFFRFLGNRHRLLNDPSPCPEDRVSAQAL